MKLFYVGLKCLILKRKKSLLHLVFNQIAELRLKKS